MDTISVDKTQLLDTLKANKQAHEEEFNETWGNYVQAFIDKLKERLAEVEAGSKPNHMIDILVPRSYADEYERVIQMLEWSQSNSVNLTHREFTQWVQDNWDWKDMHLTTANAYNKLR